VRASFWRPLSRRGFVGTGSYPAPSCTLSGGLWTLLPSALLPKAARRHPCGHQRRRELPLRQIRRDRRRVRTTDNRGPVRLPSVRPELCSPGGLGLACCSRAQPRPAPCRLPRSLPASSKAGGPLQAISSLPFALRLRMPCGCAVRCEKDASLRLLQPTPQNEHPPDRSIPGCVSLIRLAPNQACACSGLRRGFEIASSSWAKGLTKPGLGPRLRFGDELPSGASLDGEPPASASAATLTGASEVEPRET